MGRTRCRHYNDDGSGEGCPRLGYCDFSHPTEVDWDTARPFNRNNNWSAPISTLPQPMGTSKPRGFRQGGGEGVRRCRYYEDDGTPISGGCRRPTCSFVHPHDPEWATGTTTNRTAHRKSANEFASNANTAPLGSRTGSGSGWGNTANDNQDFTMADSNAGGSTGGWGAGNEDSAGGWGASDTGGGGNGSGGWGNSGGADDSAGGWGDSAESWGANDSAGGWGNTATTGGWGDSGGGWGSTGGSGSNGGGWGNEPAAVTKKTASAPAAEKVKSNGNKPATEGSGGWGSSSGTGAWGVETTGGWGSGTTSSGWGSTTNEASTTGWGNSAHDLPKKPVSNGGGWGSTDTSSSSQWGAPKKSTTVKETSGWGNSSTATSGGWGSSETTQGASSSDVQGSVRTSEPETSRSTRPVDLADSGYSADTGKWVERANSAASNTERDESFPTPLEPPSPSFTNTSHRSIPSTRSNAKLFAKAPKDAETKKAFFEEIISALMKATQAKTLLKQAEADCEQWKRTMGSAQYKHGSRTARERLEAIRDEKHRKARQYSKELSTLTDDLSQLTGVLGIDIGYGAELKNLQVQIDEIRAELRKLQLQTEVDSGPAGRDDTRDPKRQKLLHEIRPLSETKAALKAQLRQLENKLDDLEQEPISYDVVWEKLSRRLEQKLDEFSAEHLAKDEPSPALSLEEVLEEVKLQKEVVARIGATREQYMVDMASQVQELADQVTKQAEAKKLPEASALREMQRKIDELQSEKLKDAERIRKLELDSQEMREQLQKISAAIQPPVVTMPEILSAIDPKLQEYNKLLTKQIDGKLVVARYDCSRQIEEEHQRLISQIWPGLEKSAHLVDTICDFFGQYAPIPSGDPPQGPV